MPFGLANETVKQINAVFARFPQIDRVKIYGSRAKGTYQNGSDIDLCIFADDLTLSQLQSIELALDDLLLPYTFDLTLYKQLQNAALKEHIDRLGVLFYSR